MTCYTDYNPSSAPVKRIICCYNGEIFNSAELRRKLIGRGYRFNTRCDGEVIANLYSDEGNAGLARLDGQYAVALWDRQNKTGVLARDEFGVLPLFFAPLRDFIAFASSLSAFFELVPSDLELNRNSLFEVCTFWSPVGRTTFLKQVLSVLPGEIITVHNGRWISEKRKFQVPSHHSVLPSSLPSQADISRGISRAVRRRMPDEVKFGVYLSGGVDSTLIAALAAKEIGSVTALSVSFPESQRDEGPVQEQIAETLGLQHLTVSCEQKDIAEYFETAVKHAEVPLVRTAPVGTYLLSRLALNHGIKVALAGEGADEVFGGYDIYRSIYVSDRILALGSSTAVLSKTEILDWLTRDPFAQVLCMRGIARNDQDSLYDQIVGSNLSRFGPHILRWKNTSALATLLAGDLRQQYDPTLVLDHLNAILPSDYDQYEPLCKAALLDFNTLLVGYLLSSQGDRMATAHSVELRVPYLDRDLVRAVWNIPSSSRMHPTVTKPMLRQALRPFVKDPISSRPKKAYAAMDLDLEDDDVWERMEKHLSPDTIEKFGIFDLPIASELIRAARGTNECRNDFISPVALIASTHILAQHFSDLACSAGRSEQSELQVDREINDQTPGR